MKYCVRAGRRESEMLPLQVRRLRGLQELSVMKFFTGSLAAGLVLLAGGAQAQVPRALHGGIGCRSPLCGGAAPGSRAALRARAALRIWPRACCRRRKSTPCCAITDSRRSASRRLRGFVYTIAVIDRGGADGRLIIDARNGRIIRFMPAYRMGGDNYYEEQSALHGPLGAQPPQAQAPQAPDQVQAAPRAVTAGPCREPHGADAEGQSARRQACTARRRRSSRRRRLRRSRPRRRRPPR